MSAKVIFHSYVLDGKIKFDKASNGADTASFCIKNGDEKYRMVLFSDGTDQSPFSRMKACVEKGFLDKGKPIWVEAEMSYYEKTIISEDAWKKISSTVSNKVLEDLFGSTENPSKGKFPRFKVTDWDFAIPKDYLDAQKGVKTSDLTNESREPDMNQNDSHDNSSEKNSSIQPLTLSGRFSL